MGSIAAAYDIVVHCNANKIRIPNVDPSGYSYINLLFDVTEKALSKISGNVNMIMQMRCEIPGKNCTMDVNDDYSVSEMFKIHQSKPVINLHVSDMEIIPVDEENNLVNPTTVNMQDTLVISKQNKKTVAIDVDISDDQYGDSSSDSSWRHNPCSDNEDELVLDRVSNDDSEESDTNFSDFEDNEMEIVVPDSESEEGDNSRRQLIRSKMWIYNLKDDIEFEKGQLFTNVDAFRAILKDYVIQKGFPLLRLKNERSRVTAICNAEGCQWRIHASPVADNITFQIKSYQSQHTCVMDKHCAEATSDWMAKKLVGVMRDHPNMTSKGVEAELRKYGVKPSKMQIFRAKNKALNEIEGTHAESYSKLPSYAELLRNNNPNSICKIHYDRPNLLIEPKFLRIFISFRAQKLGFLEGCRPFVGFDGCFLKGPFGGVLLTAVALDANNSIFPIAFAVIE
ncbi:uncharacterized protein LOC113769350 [Coffea eugenioides]|uniref:uncharacterized protein LOC113769350 n=1 Tax=Coffea eugenioides TaxID=49369 RepID=UPI000F606D8C|nr:uncharacterized protein LOC113769350 [Coffea eugenioides]